MLFGNYLSILKLVFIWINLNIKPVLKKINFKLVLFHPNFFSFYFISSYYLSTVLHCCPPPFTAMIHHHLSPTVIGRYWLPLPTSSTTICYRWPPLFATIHLSPAAANYHRRPPSATICYCWPPSFAIFAGRHWLPLSVTIVASHHRRLPPSHRDPHCLSLVATTPTTVCYCPLPPATTVCHRLLDYFL